MNIRRRMMRLTFVTSIAMTSGCTAYWDNKISDLCEKESRVQLFEQVVLTTKEAGLMPHSDGKIATRELSIWNTDPVFSETAITYLNETNPRVTREEVTVIRKTDRKIVAKWVEYSRYGGDIPTGIFHESSFRCPGTKVILNELQQLFVVKD